MIPLSNWGLSDTGGYTHEDEAFKALPRLLKRDFGLVVKGKLKRGYLRDERGRAVEINIIGEATKDGKKIAMIGERKARLSKSNVDDFIERRLQRVSFHFKEVSLCLLPT